MKKARRRKPPQNKRASASKRREDTPSAIHALLARLERASDAKVTRLRELLGRTIAEAFGNPRLTEMQRRARVLKARARLDSASLDQIEIYGLRQELTNIVNDAERRITLVEIETQVAASAAIARFHARRVMRQAPKPTVPLVSVSDDVSADLMKAKQAAAIVIADRNKLREELERLAADPQSVDAAEEIRKELSVQEAAVEDLKRSLRVLSAAVAAKSNEPS